MNKKIKNMVDRSRLNAVKIPLSPRLNDFKEKNRLRSWFCQFENGNYIWGPKGSNVLGAKRRGSFSSFTALSEARS